MRLSHITFACAAAGSALLPLRATADVAAPVAVMAELVYPAPDSVDVPRNFALYVTNVTRVVVAAEATGDARPASAEAAFGPRWVLGDDLETGRYFVLAEPEPGTENFAGDGELVELGRFSVGYSRDVTAPGAEFDQASWFVGPGHDDENITILLVVTGRGDDPFPSPSRFEVDFGDATTSPDGVPDGESSWSTSMIRGRPGDIAAGIDRDTAIVRARVVDLNGNEGAWSAPVPLDVSVDEGRASCSQAIGAPIGFAPAVLLVAAVTAARRCARRPSRRTPRIDGRPATP